MNKTRVYRGHRYQTPEEKILLDDVQYRASFRAKDNPRPKPDHAVKWSHIARARKYMRKSQAAKRRGETERAKELLKHYGYYEGLADEHMSDELGRNLRLWWAITPLPVD